MVSGAVGAVSDRAMLGLFFIQRYRFLSNLQFAKASGLRPNSVRELLRNFERKKFLGSFGNVGIRGYGKTPKLYFLKRRGFQLLRDESGISPELLGNFREVHVTSKWSPLMYHRMATVDLLLALEEGVRDRDTLTLIETWIEYRRRREGRGVSSETSDFVGAPAIAANRIIPDAAFVLENVESGRRGLFFLETDMGTETIMSRRAGGNEYTLDHKLRQYDRYLRGGRFSKTYSEWGDFQFFTLLFVTTTLGRIENIRKEMHDLPRELHPYYRFGIFETVTEHFFNEEWRGRSPDDERFYAIVRN